jgi:hypothetical protein
MKKYRQRPLVGRTVCCKKNYIHSASLSALLILNRLLLFCEHTLDLNMWCPIQRTASHEIQLFPLHCLQHLGRGTIRGFMSCPSHRNCTVRKYRKVKGLVMRIQLFFINSSYLGDSSYLMTQSLET